MDPRHLLAMVLLACATVALVVGIYFLPAMPLQPTTLDHTAQFLSLFLIAFGLLLVGTACGFWYLASRLTRNVQHLKRKVETLEMVGGFERGEMQVLRKISELIDVLNRTRDLDAVLTQAVRLLRSILGVDVVALQIYSDEETRFFTRIKDGSHDVDLGDEIQQHVMGRGGSRLVNRLESVPKYESLVQQGYHSLIVAPLNRVKQDGRSGAVGLIAALNREPREFVSRELDLLSTFAGQAGLIIENAHLFKKTEHLALHDGLLTEIFNRRYFMHTLEEEIGKAGGSDQSGRHVALIMADIDNFKEHNDAYGHQSGDAALRSVANTFLDSTRGLDVVARYGGEEFVVILPETDVKGAMTVAETIQRRVHEHEFALPDATVARLSVSAGVAVYPEHATDATGLISAADKALYRAKDLGKNRVVAAGP